MTTALAGRSDPLFPTARTVLRALVVARWLSWLWMVAVVVVSMRRDAIRHPVVAIGCVVAVGAVAAWCTWTVRSEPGAMMRRGFVVVEATIAIGLSVLDGLVFDPGHVFETSQSLATQYPLIAMVSIGLAAGPWVAGAVGLLLGPAEWLGAVLNDFDDWSNRHAVSLFATSLFFAAAGAVFGWQARLLRRTEAEIADRRARDEVARVLHDTVLQTLALVERRTQDSDPELALAARDADRDLRRFLFGASSRVGDTLEQRVRDAVERASRHDDVDVMVNVLDDGCRVAPGVQDALAGAIGEAVANAVKHASAGRIVVFVETDDDGQVFASVRDDGVGFDPDATARGNGLTASIEDRMRDAGGRSEITSASGQGTEVRLWTR